MADGLQPGFGTGRNCQLGRPNWFQQMVIIFPLSYMFGEGSPSVFFSPMKPHEAPFLQNWLKTHMAMNQYLLIPFLEGWASIYQLFFTRATRFWPTATSLLGGLLGVCPEAREHSVRLVACHMHDATALSLGELESPWIRKASMYLQGFTIEQIYPLVI